MVTYELIAPLEGGAETAMHQRRPGVPHHREKQRRARGPASCDDEGFLFLTAQEAAFIAAVVGRFVPDEKVTPNATGVVVAGFLDRLFSQSAEQGEAGGADRSPEAPAALFRAAVAAVNRDTQEQYGGCTFAALSSDHQDDVLARLEMGQIAVDGVAPTAFFNFLLEHSMRGYLSDPDDEGGRDAEVWRLIGFLSSFSTLR